MRGFLNPPNLLSLARILLIPFVVAALAAGKYGQALVLIAVAGCTDALDGILARRFWWVTSAGAILDPVADKLLLTAVYLALGFGHLLPWWLVGIVVGRDIVILAASGLAILFTRHRKFPPSAWGKVSTIVQVAAVLVIICGRAFSSPAISRIGEWSIWLVAAATVWSGLHYAWRSRLLFRRDGSAD